MPVLTEQDYRAPARRRAGQETFAADHARSQQGARLLPAHACRSGCSPPSMAATRSIAPASIQATGCSSPCSLLAVSVPLLPIFTRAPAHAAGGAGQAGGDERARLRLARFRAEGLRLGQAGAVRRGCERSSSSTSSPARRAATPGPSAMPRSGRAKKRLFRPALLVRPARQIGRGRRDRSCRPRRARAKLPKKMERIAIGDAAFDAAFVDVRQRSRRSAHPARPTIAAACCRIWRQKGRSISTAPRRRLSRRRAVPAASNPILRRAGAWRACAPSSINVAAAFRTAAAFGEAGEMIGSSARPPARSRAGSRRYRAGAGGRSSGRDRRSSRSTARPSRRCGRARTRR